MLESTVWRNNWGSKLTANDDEIKALVVCNSFAHDGNVMGRLNETGMRIVVSWNERDISAVELGA
jgi:hypothetical protein